MVGQIQNNLGIGSLAFQGVDAIRAQGGRGSSPNNSATLKDLSHTAGAAAAKILNGANSPHGVHDRAIRFENSGNGLFARNQSEARAYLSEKLGDVTPVNGWSS